MGATWMQDFMAGGLACHSRSPLLHMQRGLVKGDRARVHFVLRVVRPGVVVELESQVVAGAVVLAHEPAPAEMQYGPWEATRDPTTLQVIVNVGLCRCVCAGAGAYGTGLQGRGTPHSICPPAETPAQSVCAGTDGSSRRLPT